MFLFITANCPCSKVDAVRLLPVTALDLSKFSFTGYLTFLFFFPFPSSHAKFPANVIALSSEGLSGRPLSESQSSPPLHSWRTFFFFPLLDIDFWLQSLCPSITCTMSSFLCPSQFLMAELWISYTCSLSHACLPHQLSAFCLFLSYFPFTLLILVWPSWPVALGSSTGKPIYAPVLGSLMEAYAPHLCVCFFCFLSGT